MKKYWIDDDGYIMYGDDNKQVIVCEMYPEHVQALTKIIESGTPAESQYGHKPDKVKPLAQYLDEYITYETEEAYPLIDTKSGLVSWCELLKQALDAYESTEQVKIRIERV